MPSWHALPPRSEEAVFQESREGYILQLCRGNLFLDSPAFNAHTTAVDALWAAVPLVTSPGECFVRPAPDPKTAHALRRIALCAPPRPAAEARRVHLVRGEGRDLSG